MFLSQPTDSTVSSTEQPPYCYSLYGVTLRSELALPQLLPGDGLATITIRFDTIPESLENPLEEGPNWQTSHGEAIFGALGVGRYWVRQGKEIIIARDPRADDDDIRAFLLGPAIGLLLLQRQIWTLHASAIRSRQGGVLFTGSSGAGKSTTLNGLLQRGYAMLADDISGICLSSKAIPQVLSAFPHSRLWADTARQLKLSTEGVPRVRQSMEKYNFPIDNFVDGVTPLHAIYVLGTHNSREITLNPLVNAAKFNVLFRNTYHRRFIQRFGWGVGYFNLMTQALSSIRVTQVTRPKVGFCLDALLDCIETDLAKSAYDQPKVKALATAEV